MVQFDHSYQFCFSLNVNHPKDFQAVKAALCLYNVNAGKNIPCKIFFGGVGGVLMRGKCGVFSGTVDSC